MRRFRRLAPSLAVLAACAAIAVAPAARATLVQFDPNQNTVNCGNCAGASAGVTTPTSTPTISTSAYTAGFVLGGIQSFTFPTSGTVQAVNSAFATGGYVGGVDWLFFTASPTGGGTTDHAAVAITSTDTPKLLGVIHATDCKLLGGATSYCQSGNAPISMKVTAGTTLFVVKQVLGAPTFTGASDDVDRIAVLP